MGFWGWMKDGFLEEAEKKGAKYQEKQALRQEGKQALGQESKQSSKKRVKQMKKEGVAHCPKCKGTSVQYVERRKRLSFGRAVVGDILAGPVGMGIGAMTSKKHKGFVKCLNCGHSWKK